MANVMLIAPYYYNPNYNSNGMQDFCSDERPEAAEPTSQPARLSPLRKV